MEEIKVGEYVRTKNGKIIKCTGFGSFRKEGQENRVKTIISGHSHYIYDYIVKYSSNIIDLIEVGDYVNGEKVTNIDKYTNIYTIEWEYGNVYTTEIINDKFIKSIITKEQFAAVEYKLDN